MTCWFCAEPVPGALLGEFDEDREFCSAQCFGDYWDLTHILPGDLY